MRPKRHYTGKYDRSIGGDTMIIPVINLRKIDQKRLDGLQERTETELASNDIWFIHTGVPGVISGKFSVREMATKSPLVARHDYI